MKWLMELKEKRLLLLLVTHLRLEPDATSTGNWAKNSNNADVNGEDGLIACSNLRRCLLSYALTTDPDGSNVLATVPHGTKNFCI